MTIARLYEQYGWTLRQISDHFGFGVSRAGQLVREGSHGPAWKRDIRNLAQNR